MLIGERERERERERREREREREREIFHTRSMQNSRAENEYAVVYIYMVKHRKYSLVSPVLYIARRGVVWLLQKFLKILALGILGLTGSRMKET